MKKVFLFVWLVISFSSNAQPGYRLTRKNINDFTLIEIKQINTRIYDRYECVIDSSTILSKLNNFRMLKKMTLCVNISRLPDELHLLSDSLKEITIRSGDKLTDLSELKQLVNLEKLNIYDYQGEALPDLHQLKELKSLSITADFYKGDKLRYIHGINHCDSLKVLNISNSAIERLDLNMSKMNIEMLSLQSCHSLKNIDAIIGSKSMKWLELNELPITRLPERMYNMTNLQSIFLTYLNQLSGIEGIRNMKKLETFSITISNKRNFEIPESFSTNTNLDTVIFDLMYVKNVAAEGLINLKKLKLLSFGVLPKSFLLPANFNSCDNLEDVEFVQSGPNNLENRKVIKKLPKLKRLFPEKPLIN